jgi:ribose transport system permease protein
MAIGLIVGWLGWRLLAGRGFRVGDAVPKVPVVKGVLIAAGVGVIVGGIVWVRAWWRWRADGSGAALRAEPGHSAPAWDGSGARPRVVGAVVIGAVVGLVTWAFLFLLGGRSSPLVAIFGALAVGAAVGAGVGLLNGTLITSLGLPPFIVTLAAMQSLRGLTLYLTGGVPVSGENFAPEARAVMDHLRPLHYGSWLGLAPAIWVALGVILVGIPLLHLTVFGRYVYAIGASERTARLCGINVERCKTVCYVIAGLTAGLTGALMTAKSGGGQPAEFGGAELTVIAAVVVGGTSLFGGQGTIVGTVLGVLMLALLYSGCVVAGISTFVQMILTGAIIVLAAALDRFRNLAR